MSKLNGRNVLLLLAGALALAGATHSMRRLNVGAAPIPGPPAARPAASSSNIAAAVIRFVKNPEMAPAFQFSDISGKPVSKADWNGKVVLVNFWATWCPPCREEIPELLALQKQFNGQLQIVGISEDDDPPAKVLKFAKQMGMNYPIVMSTPELIESYGGVAALPTSFLIDTQGRVVQKHSGLYPIDSYILEIRALLGLPVGARIETFTDTGQVFLKNAANATELPGVNFTGLNAEQKKRALHRLNAESCTCGCNLTLSQCRVNDSECAVSSGLAAQVVKEVVGGGKAAGASRSKAAISNVK
jgi:thiol-disulfide isomerase/thioredoxin